jgi:hypothetical protein
VPIAAMSVRSGSLEAGAYAVAAWHLTAVNLLLGLIRARQRPTELIDSRILRTASDDARAWRNDPNRIEA